MPHTGHCPELELVDFDGMLLLRCFLAERALWWRR
jgi:hypothetical protein